MQKLTDQLVDSRRILRRISDMFWRCKEALLRTVETHIKDPKAAGYPED